MNRDIRKITQDDIYNFLYVGISRYSAAYKCKIFEIMKYVFSFACKRKMLNYNIFSDIAKPRLVRGRRNVWSEEEIKRYLPVLKEFKYYDIVLLTLETGLRRGEVVALTWDCVNFDRRTITIDKSYVSSKGYTGFSTPKTSVGIRDVALLDNSLDLLKKRYKKRTSKYVFPSSSNANLPAHPHTVSTHFSQFCSKNNIRHIRFHDLRHTHATLLLNRDVNYKVISKRLGHTNISFTLQTYTHVLQDYEIQLFRKLSSIF